MSLRFGFLVFTDSIIPKIGGSCYIYVKQYWIFKVRSRFYKCEVLVYYLKLLGIKAERDKRYIDDIL